MAIFILPTVSPVKYRGKYPNRARSISGTAGRGTGRHIELNDGTRLWSGDDKTPEFSAGSCNDDYSAIKAAAHVMTAEQYAALREAAELSRSVVGVAGHGRRARIDEGVRALVESIKAPAAPLKLSGFPATAETAPAVRRDNVEYHAGRDARAANATKDSNPYPADGERAARWNLGWQEACDSAAPVQTIDMTPTWAAILPALLAALIDGTAVGQGMARKELARMAEIADSYVAAQKALRDA